MKTKEIIKHLESLGFAVGDKQSQYSAGNGYTHKYELTGSKDIRVVTCYGNIKCKANGFIVKNNQLQNFYVHGGKGFTLTESFDRFIELMYINNVAI